MLLSLPFAVLGAGLVVLMLIKLSVPGFFDATVMASYGRLRALALNSFVYGFAGLGATGLAYYMTPRLAGTGLAGERLASLGVIAHAAVVAAGLVAVLVGLGDGGELAEFPLIIDILMFAVLLIPPLVVTNTLLQRTERSLYVSLWYALAAAWWLPFIYLVGNLPGIDGVGTLLQSSFLVGSLIGTWLPLAGIGAAYYVIPRATGNPLYSRALAQAGFWSLVGTGLFASVTRHASSAAPDWLDTSAAVFSLGLALAAIATIANLAATLHGAFDALASSAALQMISVGALLYGGVAMFLAVQGFRSVDAIVGETSWYEGLLLASVLAMTPLLLIGAMAYALPQVAGRRLVDDLARRAIRMTAWGGGITGVLLLMAGLSTGLGWNTGAVPNHGGDYVRTSGLSDAFYLLAIATAAVAAIGVVLLTLTITRTYTSGEAIASEVLVEVDTDE